MTFTEGGGFSTSGHARVREVLAPRSDQNLAHVRRTNADVAEAGADTVVRR
jgi:hypothetical protein